MNHKKCSSSRPWTSAIIVLMVYHSAAIYAHGTIQTDAKPIDVGSFPPIEQDIQAMSNYGGAAQQAGERLVERGYDALNDLHAALLDPSATFPQKMQLITVLGEIGDSSSAEPIMQVAADMPDSKYLYQNTLLALSKLEPAQPVTDFVDQQLAQSDRDPLIQRTALAYYAHNPTVEASHWVDVYAAPDANPDVRYAALYLGGTLGMDSVKDDIIGVLQNKQKNTREYYLLLGLAEITTPDEFARLTNGLELDSGNVTRVKQYNLFRKGNPEQKDELARMLLTEGDKTRKKAAVDYLIENRDAEALKESWIHGDGFVRGAVKRAGYELDVAEDGARFKARERIENTLPVWWYAFILAVLFAAAALIYLRRRNL